MCVEKLAGLNEWKYGVCLPEAEDILHFVGLICDQFNDHAFTI